MASPIKQESCTEEVKPTITSLNSTSSLPIKTEPPSPNNNEIIRANLPMKTEGSYTNPSPNANEIIRANRLNLLVKNEGRDANPSPNNNEGYRNGDVRKKNFTEVGEEENKKNVDLNLRLPPRELRLKDRLSSNRCSEMSSNSMSISSCMPFNNQDSSSEEVEFSSTTFEVPSLVVVGCSYCLMYVMVSEIEPRCPRCHTTDVIDIFRPK